MQLQTIAMFVVISYPVTILFVALLVRWYDHGHIKWLKQRNQDLKVLNNVLIHNQLKDAECENYPQT